MASGTPNTKLCAHKTIAYIQHVIWNTVTLSWINSVPYNYGEVSTGSIKAAEWHILTMVYLPIAFITLWGDASGSPPAKMDYHLCVLNHTMVLFQAVNLVCHSAMCYNSFPPFLLCPHVLHASPSFLCAIFTYHASSLCFPHVAVQHTFTLFSSTLLPHVFLTFTTWYPVYI